MAEAHEVRRWIECCEMLAKVGPLDELRAILLLDRYEHAQDVTQQMTAALGDAVQKKRLSKPLRGEPDGIRIQRVGLYLDVGHW
jgi:hypothetical protein